MESKPKLYYLEAYGRAEPIRFALCATGVDYEDIVVPNKYTGGEEGIKGWEEMKSKFEFGEVPMLEIDGKSLVQSRSILRYVMQRAGLYPTDKYEVYRLESLVDLYVDIETAILKKVRGGNMAKGLPEFLQETFPQRMAQIEKRLKENSSPEYLVGDKLSTADCLLCNLRFSLFSNRDEPLQKLIEDAFSKFEALNKYFEARKASFQKRLDTRPKYNL